MSAEPPGFYTREGLNVETYDAMNARAVEQADGDVAFYLEIAGRGAGPVLELACGTGRVAWPLAAAGHEVIGIDASPPMLACAAAKAVGRPEDVRRRVRFVEGDMCDFALPDRFGLVLIAFRSFQSLLTPEDQRRCLGAIRRHLRPDGRVIIDLFDPRLDWCHAGAIVPPYRGETVNPVTGKRVVVEVLRRENDPVRQVFEEDWRFTESNPDGTPAREETERLHLRWTYRQEARHLFELCGFAVESEFSDFRRSPPAYGREQVWVLRQV